MADLIRCSNCQGEVTEDSEYCPHCGYLLTDEPLQCERHPGNGASGVCIVCRRTVCEECSEENDRRVFCLDHLDVIVDGDWAEVFRSTDVNEAELARAVLEGSKFHVEVQNFGSIGYAWDGGGESPLSRVNLNSPAKVFVPLSEYLDAKQVLEDWRSAAPESDTP